MYHRRKEGFFVVGRFTLTAATGFTAEKVLLGPVSHGQSLCKSTEAVQKQSTWFCIVQMTMAVGLHNEVFLAVLQHLVLPALSPLLVISTSFPTEILRGLNQLSVVCQSVSVIPYNWEKLSTIFSFFSSMHISPVSKSPVKYILLCFWCKFFTFLLFSRKKIQAQFQQLQWN